VQRRAHLARTRAAARASRGLCAAAIRARSRASGRSCARAAVLLVLGHVGVGPRAAARLLRVQLRLVLQRLLLQHLRLLLRLL